MSDLQARVAVIQFIESLKGNKAFEATRDKIRVVSKGLFVDERALDGVVSVFQQWFRSTTRGAAEKSPEKTKQWLLDSTEPERFYVVEGRGVLAGFLIPAAVENPQRFGLPFYLGSLLPTSEYLHPGDPQLEGVRGLELRQGRVGLEVVIAKRDKKVLIPEAVLKSFRGIATHSRFLQRRYPGCEKTLLGSLRALMSLVRRARPVPKSFPLYVPYEVKTSKTKEPRVAGKFLLIEERGVLLRVLELHGRHLSDFLRQELARAPREKLGSFKLALKSENLLGFYQVGSRRTSVHARAFAEFAECVRRSRDPRERFSGYFTAVECFEKFSTLFQSAQPIERRKIAQSLERFGVDGHSFRICGGWIFVLSLDNTVIRTMARHVRLPGHRRSKE